MMMTPGQLVSVRTLYLSQICKIFVYIFLFEYVNILNTYVYLFTQWIWRVQFVENRKTTTTKRIIRNHWWCFKFSRDATHNTGLKISSAYRPLCWLAWLNSSRWCTSGLVRRSYLSDLLSLAPLIFIATRLLQKMFSGYWCGRLL